MWLWALFGVCLEIGAVLVSGFVALTLSPMLCSKLLRHNPQPGRFDAFMERQLTRVTNGYARVLGASLRVRWIVVGVMLASAVGSWWLLGSIRQELAPMEDRGVVLATIMITISTLINAFGVKLMTRINSVGVFVELTAAVLLILWWKGRLGTRHLALEELAVVRLDAMLADRVGR